jgi:hypothetical protein
MSSIRHLFGSFSFTFWRQYLEFVQSCVLSRSGWISASIGDVESQHVEAKASERKSFVMFSREAAFFEIGGEKRLEIKSFSHANSTSLSQRSKANTIEPT